MADDVLLCMAPPSVTYSTGVFHALTPRSDSGDENFAGPSKYSQALFQALGTLPLLTGALLPAHGPNIESWGQMSVPPAEGSLRGGCVGVGADLLTPGAF